jgi:hypothetical protein
MMICRDHADGTPGVRLISTHQGSVAGSGLSMRRGLDRRPAPELPQAAFRAPVHVLGRARTPRLLHAGNVALTASSVYVWIYLRAIAAGRRPHVPSTASCLLLRPLPLHYPMIALDGRPSPRLPLTSGGRMPATPKTLPEPTPYMDLQASVPALSLIG